jgi:hypothetical protein
MASTATESGCSFPCWLLEREKEGGTINCTVKHRALRKKGKGGGPRERELEEAPRKPTGDTNEGAEDKQVFLQYRTYPVASLIGR